MESNPSQYRITVTVDVPPPSLPSASKEVAVHPERKFLPVIPDWNTPVTVKMNRYSFNLLIKARSEDSLNYGPFQESPYLGLLYTRQEDGKFREWITGTVLVENA